MAGGEEEAEIFHIFCPRFEKKIIVCRQDEEDFLEVFFSLISPNFS